MTFQGKSIECSNWGTTFTFNLEDQKFFPLNRAGISPYAAVMATGKSG